MSCNRPAWENSDIFRNGSLSMKDNSTTPVEGVATTHLYGPAQEGVTHELCAGIVDKKLPLKEIAREEVLEETGYRVEAEKMNLVTSFWSNIGTAGSKQYLFYCEVTDEMHVSAGGGDPSEGELIDVVLIPISQIDQFILDEAKKKSIGLCFGFTWFAKNILPTLNKV